MIFHPELRITQHKRFMPFGIHPNFCFAKTSFMLESLTDCRKTEVLCRCVSGRFGRGGRDVGAEVTKEERKMYRTTKKLIAIALLILSVPFTAYSQDLSSDLCQAAKQGDITTVKALLSKGVDVNAKDKDGATALMCAAKEGQTETIEALLAKGADVNAKSEDGVTALILAAMKGYTEIVRLLKQAGAKE